MPVKKSSKKECGTCKACKPSKPKAVKTKEEKPIGEVVHFFSHISVAVIKLASPVSVGDEIRIVGGEDTDFNQKIESMEVDHAKITKAKKGQEVGMKAKEKVREGYKVYKV